jgi:uncharacterized protein
MSSKIFINLPVTDLKRSMEFYTGIGFTNNPSFTDQTAAAMSFTDIIIVMLLTRKKFAEFTDKAIADTKKVATCILSLSVESTSKLNEIVNKAVDSGGKEPQAARDYGFMLQRSFEDPDGHLWEVIYMDQTRLPQKNN